MNRFVVSEIGQTKESCRDRTLLVPLDLLGRGWPHAIGGYPGGSTSFFAARVTADLGPNASHAQISIGDDTSTPSPPSVTVPCAVPTRPKSLADPGSDRIRR